MTPIRLAPLLLAAGCATAWAQPKPEPGLWEHAVTMKSQSGQMEQAMAKAQEQMAKLPPEQRKQMEDMMAARGVGMTNKGHTIRVCLTKEDAERGDLPPQNERCKQEITSRSAAGYKVKFSCDGPPPTTGEGEVSFSGPKAYSGRMAVNTVTRGGQAERLDMQSTGKWLSSDCGNIKPAPRSPAK